MNSDNDRGASTTSDCVELGAFWAIEYCLAGWTSFMPKLSHCTDVALGAFIRVLLIGSLVHCGMIVAGYFAASMDGPTEVGFPWVFARWGGLCYGTCARFRADHLVATVSFWLAIATAWAWLKLAWAAKNPESNLIRK